MKSYNEAQLGWISRVPETSTAAKSALEEIDEPWQALSDGSGDYVVRMMELPQGKERWVIVRTHAQLQATDGQEGEENPTGVGKMPLAPLQAGLCLPS